MPDEEPVLTVTAYVATSRHDDTYNPDALHPFGHLLVVDGQAERLPAPCGCPIPSEGYPYPDRHR